MIGKLYTVISNEDTVEVKQLPCFANKQLFIFASCRAQLTALSEHYLYFPGRVSIDQRLVRSTYEEYLHDCEFG
jgi:hypothetical protein